MTNILQAIHTVVSNDIPDFDNFYRSQNKINAAGDALELFIKDIFANTLNEINELKNKKDMSKFFLMLVMLITLQVLSWHRVTLLK